MIKPIFTLFLLLYSCVALSGATDSTVKRVLIYEQADLVYVYPTSGVQQAPPCHGSNGNYYSFSMSRPRAKEYLSALLFAKATGATVRFTGADDCIDQLVSETLLWLWVD